MTTTSTIRLLIVDDQALVRQGLAQLLSLDDEIEIVGQGADGRQAIDLISSCRPDVVLMDLRMPNVDGVTAIKKIREANPEIRILVLTTFDDDESIVTAMQAGASGYLLKDAPSERLAAAIKAVNEGYTQLAPSVTPKLLSLMNPLSTPKPELLKSFTSRELDILKLIGEGKSNKEIAETLFITEGTVKNHITRILSHLNLQNRTEVAVWVQKNLRLS